MAVTTTKTNKPINPRGNDQSSKGYNRAELYTGKALDFDGTNDTLSTDYAPSSNIQTTAYWVKLDSLTTNYALGGFVNGTTDHYGLYYWGANSNKWFGFNTWNSDSYGIGAPDFVDDWFHIVAEYNFTDFTKGKIWVNGQELSISQTLGTTLQRTTANRTFKIDTPVNGQEMNGKISGVKVFEGSLTAAQVADLYNNPEKIVPTGVADSALKLWLPMMEGAGTTAYDGSGNGNHGTISGATWTHGIGSPVSQTAVISWNKGQNLLTYSEDFTQWGNARTTDTANATTAPDGSDNAIKLEQESGQTNAGSIYLAVTLTGGNDYQINVFAKAAEKNWLAIYDTNANRSFFDIANGVLGTNNSGGTATIEAFANDWYKCTITYTEPSTGGSNVAFYLADADNSTTVTDSGGIYLWGPSIALEGKNNSYLPTYGTIQNSDVLLPQGLTSGRDITGVNLFENVRKQGALNLDGNSWAEVHDNASLDITDAITAEMWIYWNGEANKGLLGRWETIPSSRSFVLYKSSSTKIRFYVSSDGSAEAFIQNSTSLNAGWNHIVGVCDGSNIIAYLNGSADGSASYSSGINANTLPLEIGRHSYDSSFAYNDQIAQPRIYNRALTAEEVQRNYDAGKNIYTNS